RGLSCDCRWRSPVTSKMGRERARKHPIGRGGSVPGVTGDLRESQLSLEEAKLAPIGAGSGACVRKLSPPRARGQPLKWGYAEETEAVDLDTTQAMPFVEVAKRG
ncbi:hypothetical protein Dimus_036788, partial [Dionaea muscipula]